MPRRPLVASLTVASAVVLVVACTGGPGSLGTFGDDGLEGQDPGPPPSTSGSNGQGGSSGVGASSSSSSTSSSSTSSSTSSSGSTFDAGQRYACGTTTCAASQYCVSPCCGGAQQACYVLDSGTTCPSGFSYGFCNEGGGYGCVPDPCTPPPPYCTGSLSGLPAGCSQDTGDPRKVVCVCA